MAELRRALWRSSESLAETLAEVDLSARSVRVLGVVALTVAIGVPVFAGWRGWLSFPVAVPVEVEGSDAEAIRPRLVWLPGGSYWMGSESGSGDERPRHEVTVSAFAICETEVSLRQYELVTGERPENTDADEHPVRYVSWEDAVAYLNALTRLENRARADAGEPPLTRCYDEGFEWDEACTGYRLPTEAEWEYAARAGSTTEWSFGGDVKEICKYGNVDDSECDDGFESLAPVKTDRLEPNDWGLHGVHGNVWEWVFDGYDEGFYEDSPRRDPVNKTGSSVRVLRGGSFVHWPVDARSADRGRNMPSGRLVRGCGRGRAGRLEPVAVGGESLPRRVRPLRQARAEGPWLPGSRASAGWGSTLIMARSCRRRDRPCSSGIGQPRRVGAVAEVATPVAGSGSEGGSARG